MRCLFFDYRIGACVTRMVPSSPNQLKDHIVSFEDKNTRVDSEIAKCSFCQMYPPCQRRVGF